LTPTPHLFAENYAVSSYTFPPPVPPKATSRAASISEKTVATESTDESSRLARSKYAPPPFPPPSHPPPKFPPPVRPLPPTPPESSGQTEFSDWTLNLNSPTGSHFKDPPYIRGNRSAERKEPSKPSLGLLLPRNRPSSPFPLLRGSSSSKSLLQALAPSVTYQTRSNGGDSAGSDTSQSQKRHINSDTEESSDSSAPYLRYRPPYLDRSRTATPPPAHRAPSVLLSPGPDSIELSMAVQQESAVAKDDSSPIQPAVWRTSILDDEFRSSRGVRFGARDSSMFTMSSDRASFHTATSRMSILSIGDDSEENTIEGAYSWNNVYVVPSSSDWDIWVPGSDGYFEGEEDSQIKLASKTWTPLSWRPPPSSSGSITPAYSTSQLWSPDTQPPPPLNHKSSKSRLKSKSDKQHNMLGRDRSPNHLHPGGGAQPIPLEQTRSANLPFQKSASRFIRRVASAPNTKGLFALGSRSTSAVAVTKNGLLSPSIPPLPGQPRASDNEHTSMETSSSGSSSHYTPVQNGTTGSSRPKPTRANSTGAGIVLTSAKSKERMTGTTLGHDTPGRAAFRRTYSSHSIKVRSVEVTASSFQKIKMLGRGDVGKVYLVREKKTGKFYAMKGDVLAASSNKSPMSRLFPEQSIQCTLCRTCSFRCPSWPRLDNYCWNRT
jgi:hypothetical protein